MKMLWALNRALSNIKAYFLKNWTIFWEHVYVWKEENKFIEAFCLIHNMVTQMFKSNRNKKNKTGTDAQPKPTWDYFKEGNCWHT